MIIDYFRLYHIRMPLRYPFETSFGRITHRDCILIELCSEGLVGLGECVADYNPGYSYETSGTAWHILQEFLLPAIQGVNLENADELQQCLGVCRGHPMAKAGLEMAFWDLSGKQKGLSLKDMVGGVRDTIEVGVSIGIQASISMLLDRVARYLNDGYRRIKIKIKPGQDVVETQAVRHAFPDIRLQVDANSAYSLEGAEALKPLDDLNLLLIEQPLDEDDLWDHHKLQQQFKTPLCLDESISSPRHARQAIEMQACRVINIKAGRVGGLSAAIAIHNLCYRVGMPVWCGGMLETGVGRAANLALASLPGFTLPGDISATERYYEEDITNEWFYLNGDSTISVPTGLGLGVTINSLALDKYSIRKYERRIG